MDKQELDRLLRRYLNGECTKDEQLFVETWYSQIDVGEGEIAEQEVENDLAEIRSRWERGQIYRIKHWMRYAAVVVMVLGVSVTIYFAGSTHRNGSPEGQVAKTTEVSIPPGGNRARLTLADGKTIDLVDSQGGIVMTDGLTYSDGSAVLPQGNGDSGSGIAGGSIRSDEWELMTLSTPKGGQYQVVLPDGTKVWMNAASSLTYAPKEASNERVVYLAGEAYFEVVRDFARPFKVITDEQTIEVLGTDFNVSSYSDDPIMKTTLIAGAVRVVDKMSRKEAVLKPGEQAVSSDNAPLQVLESETADAIAWKSGLFRFDNTDIETIMRQLSRWYDVEVVFDGVKPDIKLWGEVYRDVDATQALEILTYFNLKYRIETENGTKRIVIYA